LTLNPPKPPRIYVVLIDPSTRPRNTKSFTIYNIKLEEAESKVRECFKEK
jgi:hypothetical protein